MDMVRVWLTKIKKPTKSIRIKNKPTITTSTALPIASSAVNRFPSLMRLSSANSIHNSGKKQNTNIAQKAESLPEFASNTTIKKNRETRIIATHMKPLEFAPLIFIDSLVILYCYISAVCAETFLHCGHVTFP